MGTWGTALSSNDTFADVYSDFFQLYNGGLDVKKISENLIAANKEIINDPETCNNFWFALAKAQWECKSLDLELLHKLKQIIFTGSDLGILQQLGASEKDIRRRKSALDGFLADLEKERPKAKARKKKIIRQPISKKGDCLTFKLQNGNNKRGLWG